MAIHEKRVRVLNESQPRKGGAYVLYLMQQANRAHPTRRWNSRSRRRNRLGLPVVACFGLLDGASGFPEANARHYAFLLAGPGRGEAALEKRGVGFVMRKALARRDRHRPRQGGRARWCCDRGYLAIQKRWYGEIAKAAKTRDRPGRGRRGGAGRDGLRTSTNSPPARSGRSCTGSGTTFIAAAAAAQAPSTRPTAVEARRRDRRRPTRRRSWPA